MKRIFYSFMLMAFAIKPVVPIYAGGSGVSSTLIPLIQPPSARASSLGEAYISAFDDISALNYNPASLGSLSSSQVSYLFQRGILDDSYNQLSLGTPRDHYSLGVSIGYYNGGNIHLYDGVNESNVIGKSDLSVALGYAYKAKHLTPGISIKYISSELANTVRGKTFAMDLGVQHSASNKLKIGGAFRNLGPSLKYANSTSPLPRIFQLGMTYKADLKYPTALMFDLPYFMHEKQLRTSLGVETVVGPLALRAGYRSGSEAEGFTLGTGFSFQGASLDYSLGLVNNLNTKHVFSLSMRFGQAVNNSLVSQKSELKPLVTNNSDRNERNRARVYEVKKGDTLKTIAESMYGDPDKWAKIYFANSDRLNSTDLTEVIGRKLRVPKF